MDTERWCAVLHPAHPFPIYKVDFGNVAGLLLTKLLIDNNVTGVTGL